MKQHNYNSLWTIYRTLISEPIVKLKKSWKILPKKSQRKALRIVDVFSPIGDYSEYRQRIQQPNAIPARGLF